MFIFLSDCLWSSQVWLCVHLPHRASGARLYHGSSLARRHLPAQVLARGENGAFLWAPLCHLCEFHEGFGGKSTFFPSASLYVPHVLKMQQQINLHLFCVCSLSKQCSVKSPAPILPASSWAWRALCSCMGSKFSTSALRRSCLYPFLERLLWSLCQLGFLLVYL